MIFWGVLCQGADKQAMVSSDQPVDSFNATISLAKAPQAMNKVDGRSKDSGRLGGRGVESESIRGIPAMV